jgi:anti-sigma B factor antagonist
VSEPARVEVDRHGSGYVLRIRGEVDMSNARELSAAIEGVVPNGASTVAVDLGETTYMDSAGIQLLFLLAEKLKARRHELRIIVPKDAPVRSVLELTGLAAVVRMDDQLG